jgi:HAE1 family hydrophobic/amphiphilic exporter-1
MRVPKGFLSSEDSGSILGFTQAAQGISVESMREHQLAITSIVTQDPNVANTFSLAGAGFAGSAGNSGIFFCHLKPHPERRLSTDEVINELRPKLLTVPGIIAFMTNPPPIQIGGQLTKSPYQFTLHGTDSQQLYRESGKLLAKMSQLPTLQDVNTDLQIANPQVNVEIDRDKASALGVTAFQVEDALASGFGDRQVSTIFRPDNEYRVITELEPQYQRDPAALSCFISGLRPANSCPECSAKLTNSWPATINHSGQLPSVTLSFGLKPGVALGDAVKEVENLARNTLSGAISASFQGEAQAYQASLVGLGPLLTLTILVIYVLLGILYESLIHPLTILSGLPSAGLGAILTLMIFKYPLDLYGFVGIIMLIGIVKKNAIMMIDFAFEAERNEGKDTLTRSTKAALFASAPSLMMTIMAALMGTLPIALTLALDRKRAGLWSCRVGGLVVSQLITLYITPVYYTYLIPSRRRLGCSFGAAVRSLQLRSQRSECSIADSDCRFWI